MKRFIYTFVLYLALFPSHAAYAAAPSQAETPILEIDTGGHKAVIRHVMFTKDGRYLISASDDKTIRVWDVNTGETVRVLRGQIGAGNEGKIYAVTLSPDNQLLAVGGFIPFNHESRNSIRLFNFQTGEVVTLFEKGHGRSINDLAFSPDGRLLISGSKDNTARIWDIRTGKTLQVLEGHKDDIYAVAFSPDGSRVITGGDDDTLKLWKVSSGSLIATLKGHTGDVASAVFAPPDGRYILSGSWDKTIRLWDGRTGKFIKVLATQDSRVLSLSISADGTKVVTGCGGPTTNYVFSIPSGEQLASFSKHNNAVIATDISYDETMVATGGGNDMEIYLWDINTGRVKQKMVGKGKMIWSVGFAKDGQAIAWGRKHKKYISEVWQEVEYLNGRAIAWGKKHSKDKIQNTPLEQSFQLRKKDSRQFQLVLGKTLSGDTGYLQAIESVGSLSIRTKNGKIHPTLQILKNGWVIHEITRDSTSGGDHRSLTLTPDGKTAISGSGHGIITSYNPKTGKKIHDFIGHTSDVFGVAVSPDSYFYTLRVRDTLYVGNTPSKNRLLISGSADQTVRLWDIETGKLLLTIFHATDNEWVAWTPEGFYTASPKGDQYVGWHVNKGEDKPADYYTAKQFRRYLYRPDIVADTLRLGSSKMAVAKAGMDKITVGMLVQRAPVGVKIASVDMKGQAEAEITVQLAQNKTTTPERITLYINGAQMLDNSERVLVGVKPGDTLRYQVRLPARKNHIRVLVENQWAETSHELWYENRNWREPTLWEGDQLKGTLYVNAVGINRYPKLSAKQQLQSPGLDARSMLQRFAKLQGRLYKRVIPNLLTDNDGEVITAARIEALLMEQARKAGPEDTSLFFLAGHGVTDSKGDYHLVTADSDIAVSGDQISLKGGASFDWERLHKILDTTVGKRIVIVDTCQAGSVFSTNRVDIQKLIKDIHDVNAIVYSGTSRQQFGLETAAGGVFTQTILAGINGEASYENGRLLFVSLREYVDSEVPKRNREIMQNIYRNIEIEEKEGKEVDFDSTQKPVSVIPDGMSSFVIYRK